MFSFFIVVDLQCFRYTAKWLSYIYIFSFRFFHIIGYYKILIVPCTTSRSLLFMYSSAYLLTPNFQFIPPLTCFVFSINQNPRFTLEFILCVVHSMGFDKCIVMYIHQYNIRQNILALFILHSSITPDLLSSPEFCLFQNVL